MKENLRRGMLVALAVSQLLFFPVYSGRLVQAQETTPPPSTETTPTPPPAPEPTPSPTPAPPAPPAEPPKAGPPPSGADSDVFVYDYATDTWESFLYSYNPVTKVRTMKDVPTVRYNFNTKLWEKLGWTFSAPTQLYVPFVVSTHSTQPEGKIMGPQPSPAFLASGSGGGTNIDGAGPDSNTSIGNTTNNNTGLTFNNTANYDIILDLLAQSGNASVLGNTTGGSATTGSAYGAANVLNQVQSIWDIGDLLTFSSNLYGDIYGDLLVNTTNIGPKADVAVDTTKNNNLDIEVNNDTNITNDINVVAQSGDALVSGNTTGGDALSGDANAFANIINMINSSIDSGANFMGTLNIYGNFDGDILFPKGALETLIASTGPESSVNVANETNNNLDVNVNNNTNIANNINANAASGTAMVADNTTGGNATSGDATSTVTMLNLTGKDVVSENTLLVFINVLGKWVGVLMDAPAGTTAAAIGGGATVNSDTTTNNSITYNENNNANITNNINVLAESGDASVIGNTTGGDATTGDANATVNVANLVGSNISTKSWFGVLFINVFGTWAGSFGVDTEAGDHVAGSNDGSGGSGGQGGEGPNGGTPTAPTGAGVTAGVSDIKVYGFEPTIDGGHRAVALGSGGQGGEGVLGVSTQNSDKSEADVLGTDSVLASALQDAGTPQSPAFLVGGTVLLLTVAMMFGNKLILLMGTKRKRD